MKTRIFLSLFLLIVIAVTALLPSILMNYIASYEYTTLSSYEYQKKIVCSGTFESNLTKEVYLPTAVIPSDVNFSIGDYVNKGDIIATINTELTESVLAGGYLNTIEELENLDLSKLKENFDLETLEKAISAGSFLSSSNHQSEVSDNVVAPISGTITKLNMQSDVITSTIKPVVTIADTSSLVLKALVSESEVENVQVGDNATIYPNGLKDEIYYGTVQKIYPEAKQVMTTTSTATYVEIEIRVANQERRIKPGYTASVDIFCGGEKNLNILPYEAIKQDENNQEYVYVYKNNVVTRQNIESGIEVSDGVEVVSGITKDDVVLVTDADTIDTKGLIYLRGIFNHDGLY